MKEPRDSRIITVNDGSNNPVYVNRIFDMLRKENDMCNFCSRFHSCKFLDTLLALRDHEKIAAMVTRCPRFSE